MMGEGQENFSVVDFQDDFVMFTGSLEECKEFMDQTYAGLIIVPSKSLNERKK